LVAVGFLAVRWEDGGGGSAGRWNGYPLAPQMW